MNTQFNTNTQKNVIASWVFGLFFLGVTGAMAYTTYHAVLKGTQDAILAWLTLFVFDAGAFSGFQMYIGNAKGARQRTAAQAILWIDFALAAAMVGGALDKLPAGTIGYIVWISIAFNAMALYYYKTNSPETLQAMQEQDEEDEKIEAARQNRRMLFNESMRQARAGIMRQAKPLGTLMSLRTQADLKYAMNLPMTEDERKVFEEDIIDVQALPAPAEYDEPIGNPAGVSAIWEAVKAAFFTKRQSPQLVMRSQRGNHSPSDQPKSDQQDVPQDNSQA